MHFRLKWTTLLRSIARALQNLAAAQSGSCHYGTDTCAQPDQHKRRP